MNSAQRAERSPFIDDHVDIANRLAMRSVTINGRRTTMRLEPSMWNALRRIAEALVLPFAWSLANGHYRSALALFFVAAATQIDQSIDRWTDPSIDRAVDRSIDRSIDQGRLRIGCEEEQAEKESVHRSQWHLHNDG